MQNQMTDRITTVRPSLQTHPNWSVILQHPLSGSITTAGPPPLAQTHSNWSVPTIQPGLVF
jgi:hypothetical protein